MSKYRKKPVVVDAEQWFPDKLKTPKPDAKDSMGIIWCYDPFGQVAFGIIETLEGNHEVTIGDWIITGIKGEKYPCKPDIFAKTYEPVEDSIPTDVQRQAIEMTKGILGQIP